jgi:RNA polymerase sigma-70 factor (ECF subfamily)
MKAVAGKLLSNSRYFCPAVGRNPHLPYGAWESGNSPERRWRNLPEEGAMEQVKGADGVGSEWPETMVRRAQDGDRSAYGELIQHFQPAVYALAMNRLRNSADAEDLAQEVFVQGMGKLDQLREPRCFGGWLRQITVRMAFHRMARRRRIRDPWPKCLDNEAAKGAGPLAELEQEEKRMQVRDGLNRLKAQDQATLEAFYLRGRSLKQMSREFETPVGTIKSRLFQARKRLRRHLKTLAEPA